MRLPSVYFGAADRQMEYFLDAESFYDSLVSGLLFQGNIVLPDIFFYISEHIADDDHVEVLSTTLKLPFVKQLFTVPPEVLLNLRNGEYGVLYFRALSEWQAHPSEVTANVLLDRLKDYVDKISNLYVTRGRNPLYIFRYIQPNVPTGEASITSFVTETVFKVLESKISPLGLLTFASDRIACAYCLLPPALKHVIDEGLGMNKKLEFEVTRRKQLLVAGKYSAEARLTQ